MVDESRTELGDQAELRDRVTRLVEFLRDLVRSRSVFVSDVNAHPAVLWVGKGDAVTVRSGAAPGQTLLELIPGDDGHTDLSAMIDALQADPESLELVLANALCTVTEAENDTEPLVREHLISQPLVAIRDDETGAVRVSTATPTRPAMHATHLLSSVDGIDLADAATVYSQVAALPTAAHAQVAELADYWRSVVQVDPARVSMDIAVRPAVVLRHRGRSDALRFYDAMLARVHDTDTDLPVGLTQLVTSIESEERVTALAAAGATSAEDLIRDALYPLPSNVEQRDVLARLGADSGVVVEGPPGTGKTQTIANVVSALLAKGQRVLVTSEKPAALAVLRDLLPPELRELTVSIADVSRDHAEAVVDGMQAIAERKSTFSAAVADAEIEDLTDRRAQAVARREKALHGLWEMRRSETDVHDWVAGDYQGTAAQIVRSVVADTPRFDWLPEPLDSPLPPLDTAEMLELRDLLRAPAERTDRSGQRFVDLDEHLPSATDLDAVAERLGRRPGGGGGGDGSMLSLLADVDSARLVRIKECCDRLAAAAAQVRQFPPVLVDMADRLLSGQSAHLWSRVTALSPIIADAANRDRAIGAHRVVAEGAQPGDADIFRAAADHLRHGGRWRGRLLRSEQQRAVQESGVAVTVDGREPTEAASLELAADHLTVTAAVHQVHRVLADLHVPVDTTGSRSAQLDRLVRLDRQLAWVSDLVGARDDLVHELAAISPSGPRPASVAEAVAAADEAGSVAATNDAQIAETELAGHARTLAAEVERGPSPEGDALVAALRSGDAAAIRDARRSYLSARSEQADQNALDLLVLRLRSKAPEFYTLLADTVDDPVWDLRLRELPDAWAWRRARAWVIERSDPDAERRVQAAIDEADADLAMLTTKLAAAQAWRESLERVSVAQVQAVASYRDHMINLGKGSGKYADRFRAAAREAMDHASTAVPAWIMSLSQVSQMLAPEPNSFDVVIVEEASQADITSAFLLWLAPRVVVVGDDKQCAPTGLSGVTLDEAFAKLDSYLPDLPHYLRDGLTPRSSLFSLLRSRFGHLVRLREHFRSMPEIIEYSSRQFYGGSPLVPVRQFGADRLEPLKTVAVDGTATGQGAALVNVDEATAIVAAIVDCLADPRYDGLDFGVIALQGTRQVDDITRLLAEAVDETTWRERRLRVGTPPDFQGDERRVMFLSMVVSDPAAITALTRAESQRRFNVAASRAMDQMWLFHSVDLDDLRPTDLRYSLLGYMEANAGAAIDPMPTDVPTDRRVAPFESLFEQRVFTAIAARGYYVSPKVKVNRRTIDLVVTGAQGRMAVECDGDEFTTSGRQARSDMERERELRRCGWEFWRVRESEFVLDADAAMAGLWDALEARGVRPGSVSVVEAAANDPTANDPTANDPTADDQCADDQTGDQPTGDTPTGDQPTGDQPTGDQPTGDRGWTPTDLGARE